VEPQKRCTYDSVSSICQPASRDETQPCHNRRTQSAFFGSDGRAAGKQLMAVPRGVPSLFFLWISATQNPSSTAFFPHQKRRWIMLCLSWLSTEEALQMLQRLADGTIVVDLQPWLSWQRYRNSCQVCAQVKVKPSLTVIPTWFESQAGRRKSPLHRGPQPWLYKREQLQLWLFIGRDYAILMICTCLLMSFFPTLSSQLGDAELRQRWERLCAGFNSKVFGVSLLWLV